MLFQSNIKLNIRWKLNKYQSVIRILLFAVRSCHTHWNESFVCWRHSMNASSPWCKGAVDTWCPTVGHSAPPCDAGRTPGSWEWPRVNPGTPELRPHSRPPPAWSRCWQAARSGRTGWWPRLEWKWNSVISTSEPEKTFQKLCSTIDTMKKI